MSTTSPWFVTTTERFEMGTLSILGNFYYKFLFTNSVNHIAAFPQTGDAILKHPLYYQCTYSWETLLMFLIAHGKMLSRSSFFVISFKFPHCFGFAFCCQL